MQLDVHRLEVKIAVPPEVQQIATSYYWASFRRHAMSAALDLCQSEYPTRLLERLEFSSSEPPILVDGKMHYRITAYFLRQEEHEATTQG